MISPDEWWVVDESRSFDRGRLIWAFIPHVDQNPYTLIPTGRKEPTVHKEATVKISPLNIRQITRYPQLPVAALPQIDKEVFTVYRAKKRPAIIISSGGTSVEDALKRGKPKSHYAPTILVAPFYGGDQEGQRAGFLAAFTERVRRCEYPQFMWDMLPLDSSTKESVVRLDHIQPIGRSEDSVEITKYRLSSTALFFFDEWLEWIVTGQLRAESILGEYREELLKIPYCH